jgi:hypothetical protein
MAPPNPPTSLSKLTPRDFQAVIYVRIIRKWNFTGKYENGPILHVDLVLGDAEVRASAHASSNTCFLHIPDCVRSTTVHAFQNRLCCVHTLH